MLKKQKEILSTAYTVMTIGIRYAISKSIRCLSQLNSILYTGKTSGALGNFRYKFVVAAQKTKKP